MSAPVRTRRLRDLLLQVLPEPVVGHPALHLDAELRHLVGELQRVVLPGEDRLGQVLADLVGVDVECGRELDVADVVAAEVDVHQSGHDLARVGVAVVLDALHERVRAVADADDRDADLVFLVARSAVAGTVGLAHWRSSLLEVTSALRSRAADTHRMYDRGRCLLHTTVGVTGGRRHLHWRPTVVSAVPPRMMRRRSAHGGARDRAEVDRPDVNGMRDLPRPAPDLSAAWDRLEELTPSPPAVTQNDVRRARDARTGAARDHGFRLPGGGDGRLRRAHDNRVRCRSRRTGSRDGHARLTTRLCERGSGSNSRRRGPRRRWSRTARPADHARADEAQRARGARHRPGVVSRPASSSPTHERLATAASRPRSRRPRFLRRRAPCRTRRSRRNPGRRRCSLCVVEAVRRRVATPKLHRSRAGLCETRISP